MASAQVVETSVTNNSPSQDSYHPDDLIYKTLVMVIGLSGVQCGLQSYKLLTKSAKGQSDLLIKSLNGGKIGQQKVLLPINHKYYSLKGSQKGQKASENLTKNSPIYDFV